MIRLLAFIAGYVINYTIARLYRIKLLLVFILGGLVPFVGYHVVVWVADTWPDFDFGLAFVSTFAFILFGAFTLAMWWTHTHEEDGSTRKKKGGGGTGAV